MPLIARFGNVKLHIYADDHNPPHFHVSTPDHDALIQISDLSVLQGQITKRNLDTVVSWASVESNRKVLENEWARLNER
ncbi:DUF4160 domain-containing protein [Ensifer aridi]|uniref:DUF4160 domain-containing protein n=1 Tax=Ensifer aridi TaxID=1708715 RepID=UPI00097CB9D6|nr:DUF4160 domain-containing protein [Ensifer aridi]MCA1409265.1 DUF4160 domain-containing protein [Ensifer sp. BRP08]MCA1451419.1 DUF4160 domain-containing protein [Ensifer sp. IC3342]